MKHNNPTQVIAVLICILLIVLCILLATPAHAYDGDRITTARQAALHEAADILRGCGYAEDSDVIRALGAEWSKEQEALDIIARVVQGEAGACPVEHQIAVAAVVVNRINSDLFPGTAREVVAQPGQYTTLYLRGFDRTSRACYEAAKIALDGTDEVPDDVIWQAQFPQGAEVWWASYVDTGWWRSTTYFCRGVS